MLASRMSMTLAPDAGMRSYQDANGEPDSQWSGRIRLRLSITDRSERPLCLDVLHPFVGTQAV